MSNQRGFTLVELLIAMAIFTFMAVIMSSGVARLFQVYEAGQSIRISQQGARTAAEAMSRDARAATVEVVGSTQLVPNRLAAGICLLNSPDVAGATETFEGTLYFLHDSDTGTYATTDHVSLWQQSTTLSITVAVGETAAAEQAALEGQCSQAAINAVLASPLVGQQVSPADTSVVIFGGDDLGGTLLAAKLGLASTEDLPDIDSANSNLTNGGTCIPSVEARYCSVTNLTVTAGPEGGSGL